MQKNKYFTCIYRSVLFCCTKGRKIKFKAFFNYKINKKRELQSIAINHSADIDYKEFIKIYRECTKEPYIFLTIYTTLPSTNTLRFRKNLFDTL